MAMAMFNKKANEKAVDACAISAGLCADGSSVSENARAALEMQGIADFNHSSVQLEKCLVDECDYIFGITLRHALAIESQHPDAKGKVFPFPTDIPDPYGQDLDVYCHTLEKIDKGTEVIISALSSGKL